MPRRLYSVLLLLIVPVALLAHEGHEALPKKGVTVKGDTVLLSLEATKAIGLKTIEVETGPIERSIFTSVVVELAPDAHAFATTQLAGRVEKVLVTPGQTVQAGDVLALLQAPELEKLLLETRTAELEHGLAEAERRRVEELAKQGVRNPREQQAAQNRVQERGNALLVTRLKLKALGLGEGNDPEKPGNHSATLLPIRSPVAGVVAMVDVSQGEIVEPEQHLFDVVKPSLVRLRAQVPEAYVPQLALNQAVEVRLRSAAPDSRPFTATIAAREGRVDPKQVSEAIWLRLAKDQPPPQAGLAGSARIVLERKEKSLLVPEQAVVRDGIETYVFTQIQPATSTQAGAFERKHVTLGLHKPGMIELTSGVFSIDSVLVQGQRQLAPLFVQGVLRPTPTARRNVGLEVGTVAMQPVAPIVETDTMLELPPTGRAIIAAPVTSKVVRVAVAQPQPVSAGTLLAELSSLEFQTLQLELIQAELSARLHRSTLESYAQVEPRGQLPEQLRIEAQTQLSIATARTASFVRRLQAFGLSADEIAAIRDGHHVQNNFSMRAPHGGEAVPRALSVGQVLKEGTPLFELQDRSRFWVRGRVFDQDLARIHPGQAARLRLASMPGYVGEARIARLDAFAHTNGRSANVWAEIQNPDGLLRENLLGRLTIEVGPPASVPALPLGALWREGSDWHVFRYERKEDRFVPQRVELARRDDRHAEVRQGIALGDAVPITAVADLRRGYGRIK